jgi:hypothetical protein
MNLEDLKIIVKQFEEKYKVRLDDNGVNFPKSGEIRYTDKLLEEVEGCVEILKVLLEENILINKKRSRNTYGSYGLKHLLERISGKYKCNTSAIIACFILNLDMIVYKTHINPNTLLKFNREKKYKIFWEIFSRNHKYFIEKGVDDQTIQNGLFQIHSYPYKKVKNKVDFDFYKEKIEKVLKLRKEDSFSYHLF